MHVRSSSAARGNAGPAIPDAVLLYCGAGAAAVAMPLRPVAGCSSSSAVASANRTPASMAARASSIRAANLRHCSSSLIKLGHVNSNQTADCSPVQKSRAARDSSTRSRQSVIAAQHQTAQR